jgi:hypothetical protein
MLLVSLQLDGGWWWRWWIGDPVIYINCMVISQYLLIFKCEQFSFMKSWYQMHTSCNICEFYRVLKWCTTFKNTLCLDFVQHLMYSWRIFRSCICFHPQVAGIRKCTYSGRPLKKSCFQSLGLVIESSSVIMSLVCPPPPLFMAELAFQC